MSAAGIQSELARESRTCVPHAARAAAACLLLVGAACSAAADVVTDWSGATLDAIRADRSAPPRAARALAMVHLAMFDAVNAIDGGFEPYLAVLPDVPRGASADAAAAGAAHAVLSALWPAQVATFDDALAATRSGLPDDDAVRDGLGFGAEVARALLAERTDDGSAAAVAYVPSGRPDGWQPTPPAFAAPALPGWAYVQPFCVPDMAAARRWGPPPLDSAEYTAAYSEVKLLGGKQSTTRTAEQSEIALFWVDGPGTATPPGHWFEIARELAPRADLSRVENARLFALLGLAVCDAAICAWDNKYVYDHWRPVTAIRAAETDGNPDTAADSAWESFIPTPAFPSYVSGHSTFSGAASRVLSLALGTDEIAFSATSEGLPGVRRAFTRLSAAANEAGRSRIYGGIHWEYDNQDGLAAGRELAVMIYDNFLRPKDDTQLAADDFIMRCGPVGLVPLAVLVPALVGMRWRRVRRYS